MALPRTGILEKWAASECEREMRGRLPPEDTVFDPWQGDSCMAGGSGRVESRSAVRRGLDGREVVEGSDNSWLSSATRDEAWHAGSDSSDGSWFGDSDGIGGRQAHSDTSAWWSGCDGSWWGSPAFGHPVYGLCRSDSWQASDSGEDSWWELQHCPRGDIWKSRPTASHSAGSGGHSWTSLGARHTNWAPSLGRRSRRSHSVETWEAEGEQAPPGHPDGQLLEELKLGMSVIGKVVNITSFGVFLSFGAKRDGVLEVRGKPPDLKLGDLVSGLVIKAIVYTMQCGRVILAPGKGPVEVRSSPKRPGTAGRRRTVTLVDSNKNSGSEWHGPFELAEASEESEWEAAGATESECDVESKPALPLVGSLLPAGAQADIDCFSEDRRAAANGVKELGQHAAQDVAVASPHSVFDSNGAVDSVVPKVSTRSSLKSHRAFDHADGVPMASITVGQRVAGHVTTTFESGIYVNFGAQRDGLMHVSDAWHLYQINDRLDDLRVQAVIHTKHGVRVLLEKAGKAEPDIDIHSPPLVSAADVKFDVDAPAATTTTFDASLTSAGKPTMTPNMSVDKPYVSVGATSPPRTHWGLRPRSGNGRRRSREELTTPRRGHVPYRPPPASSAADSARIVHDSPLGRDDGHVATDDLDDLAPQGDDEWGPEKPNPPVAVPLKVGSAVAATSSSDPLDPTRCAAADLSATSSNGPVKCGQAGSHDDNDIASAKNATHERHSLASVDVAVAVDTGGNSAKVRRGGRGVAVRGRGGGWVPVPDPDDDTSATLSAHRVPSSRGRGPRRGASPRPSLSASIVAQRKSDRGISPSSPCCGRSKGRGWGRVRDRTSSVDQVKVVDKCAMQPLRICTSRGRGRGRTRASCPSLAADADQFERQTSGNGTRGADMQLAGRAGGSALGSNAADSMAAPATPSALMSESMQSALPEASVRVSPVDAEAKLQDNVSTNSCETCAALQPPQWSHRRVALGSLETSDGATLAVSTAEQEFQQRAMLGWSLRQTCWTPADDNTFSSLGVLGVEARAHIAQWAHGGISGRQCLLLLHESEDGKCNRTDRDSLHGPHAGYAELLAALVGSAAEVTQSRGVADWLYREVLGKPPTTALADAAAVARRELGPTVVPGSSSELPDDELGLTLRRISSRGGRAEVLCVGVWRELVDISHGDPGRESRDGAQGGPHSTGGCETSASALSQRPVEAEVFREFRRPEEEVVREARAAWPITLRQRCERWRPYLLRLQVARRRLHALLMRLAGDDPYETLSVNRGISTDGVRRAYLRLSRLAHPDRAGDDVAFLEMQGAYARILEERDHSGETSTPLLLEASRGEGEKSIPLVAGSALRYEWLGLYAHALPLRENAAGLAAHCQELSDTAQFHADIAAGLACDSARWRRSAASESAALARPAIELQRGAAYSLETAAATAPRCAAVGEHALEAAQALERLQENCRADAEFCAIFSAQLCSMAVCVGKRTIQSAAALERGILKGREAARGTGSADLVSVLPAVVSQAVSVAQCALRAAEVISEIVAFLWAVTEEAETAPLATLADSGSGEATEDSGGCVSNADGTQAPQPEEEDEPEGIAEDDGSAADTTADTESAVRAWLEHREWMRELDGEVSGLRGRATALLAQHAAVLPFVTARQKRRLFALVAELFLAARRAFEEDLGRCLSVARASPSGCSAWFAPAAQGASANRDGPVEEPWWGPLLEDALGFLYAAELGLPPSARTLALRYAAFVDFATLQDLVAWLFTEVAASLGRFAWAEEGAAAGAENKALQGYRERALHAVSTCMATS